MTSSLDSTSHSWSKIALKWETYFKPPSRPSKSEENTYSNWISKYVDKEAKILLLGATPEILNVLSAQDHDIDLIDINQEMVSAMLEIANKTNRERNVTIGNWLEMPFEDDSYDLILGDAVIANVPYDSREPMIKEILRVLKPSGIYMNRAFCVPESKLYGSIDEILKAFRDKPVNETTAIELVVELQIFNYNENDHLAAMADMREMVEVLRNENGFNREDARENELLNILWEYWLEEISDKTWVYDTRKNEEINIYLPHFVIQEIFEADDHPYGKLTPLYLLKAK